MIESLEWRSESDPRTASVIIQLPPPGTPDETVDVDVLRREIEDLRRALESRPVIDQAKGILMCRYGVDGPHAFSILRRWSMDANIKVRDVAEALIEFTMAEPPDLRSEASRYVEYQLTGTDIPA